MKYTPLSDIVKNLPDAQTPLSSQLVETGRISEAGSYDVRITGLDVDKLDAGRVGFVFETSRQFYKTFLFLTNREGTVISWQLKNLLNGIFGSADTVNEFLRLTEDIGQEEALQSLRGMKLRIKLDYSMGYVIRKLVNGTYTADNGHETIGPHESITNLKQEMKAIGAKQAYLNLRGTETTDAELNTEALQNIKEAILKSSEV